MIIITCIVATILSTSWASNAQKTNRIIGGAEVNPIGKYPWQGSLKVPNGHTCGAVLISEQWALTAAHCVEFNDVDSLTVAFGQHDLWDDSVALPEVYKLSRIIVHEDYGNGPGAFPNDIAALRLATPANFNNPYIYMIHMAEGGYTYENDSAVISGWGYMAEGDQGPDYWPLRLQEATTRILGQEECISYWYDNVNDGHVCIHNPQQGIGSCNGDSGGPLVWPDVDPYLLVGLTSWGASGCLLSYPTSYVRISYFRDWIRQNTGV